MNFLKEQGAAKLIFTGNAMCIGALFSLLIFKNQKLNRIPQVNAWFKSPEGVYESAPLDVYTDLHLISISNPMVAVLCIGLTLTVIGYIWGTINKYVLERPRIRN